MATTAQDTHANHTRDHTTLITQHAFQGAQLMSLLSLSLLPFSLIRHPLRPLSTHLRRTALRTLVFGPALGAGYAFVRINTLQSERGVEESARKMRADQGERRREDYATIGAVLGGLATTTVLLRRAPLLWTLSGGASLGLAGGTLFSFFYGASTDPAGIKGEAKSVERSVKGDTEGGLGGLGGLVKGVVGAVTGK
ncbi:hypothetical protein JCM10908_002697 [Rhodotorula pacifica]|uniref:uncharacterized protein n=1 Tax=Rhodotorula pacifica TaxID=1495444 RepID=UPI00316E4EB5